MSAPASGSKPADFKSDPRYTLNPETDKWTFVGDDNVSYEYDEGVGAWFPMYNEELIKAQQSVYAVEGVNEEEPAVKPRTTKKRVYTYDEENESNSKKQKRDAPKKPITSVYVTGMPADATMDEIKQVFSKCGVIMEDLDSGTPKIKIYQDAEGRPKGDVLVTFFKEESVTLAINLLDDAEFRLGEPSSKIRVQQAVFKEKENTGDKKKATSTPNKTKTKKRLHQLQRKLDWVDEETGKKAEKFNKIVILKNMYTQQELDEDPTLLLELKEDVREECEKLGEVTNVILYDKSPGGIISVRYTDQKSAEACVLLMNNRYFAGRQISAEIYDGKEKYQKSGARAEDEDDETEKARLERYAKWLEEDGDETEQGKA